MRLACLLLSRKLLCAVILEDGNLSSTYISFALTSPGRAPTNLVVAPEVGWSVITICGWFAGGCIWLNTTGTQLAVSGGHLGGSWASVKPTVVLLLIFISLFLHCTIPTSSYAALLKLCRRGQSAVASWAVPHALCSFPSNHSFDSCLMICYIHPPQSTMGQNVQIPP